MLLRSSSTPVLGSLLSSFSSDSPNNNTHFLDTNTSFKHYTINRSPYHHPTGCLNLTNVSCNSSPISPSIADQFSAGLRRAQSEGNLEGLQAHASCSSNEDCKSLRQPKKVHGRKKCLTLETIPSFSLCNLRSRFEGEVDDGDIADEGEEGGLFGLSNKMENMVSNEKLEVIDGSSNVDYFEEERALINQEMYLARGLGIDGGSSSGNGSGSGGGGGDQFHCESGDGDTPGTEEYCKKMVQENPSNPLFLRNYAQFLYQSKRDLEGAEEYYSRAILVDPKDGEILSQYAKLVWELHKDQDRASSYFERAVQASPEDSHVHAAYASFLWEAEEDGDESSVPKDFDARGHLQGVTMASTGA